MAEVAIGLGSNLGNRRKLLSRAAEFLSGLVRTDIIDASSVWETPAWGVTNQPRFLNAVIILESALSPEQLLIAIRNIERRMGRRRRHRWGPRRIDIDILWVGQCTRRTSNLFLPHPHLEKRPFVLMPAYEVRPQKRVHGATVEAHLGICTSLSVRRMRRVAGVSLMPKEARRD